MNSSNAAHREKRNFIRMEVNTPAQISITKDNHQELGICKNLSGNGMLLELSTQYGIGDQFVVKVSSAQENGPSLDALCTVARLENDEESETFLTGVVIDKIL